MFTDAASSSLLFREVQRFRQWYVVLILAVVAVLQWWGFVTQIVLGRPFGSNPGPDGWYWCSGSCSA